MPLSKHAQLPQRTPKRIRHLRVVDVRAVHAVPRAVLRREQRLELRVALDERGGRRREEGEVVSCIVRDEAELEPDLRGALLAAEEGWGRGQRCARRDWTARGSQAASECGTFIEGAFLPSCVHWRCVGVSSSVPGSFL